MIFKSIKTKVVVFQLAFVFLAVFLMWISSYFLIMNYLGVSQKRNLEYLADFEKEEVENYFTQAKTAMERIVDAREFKDYHLTSKNLLLIELLTKFNQIFPALAYVDKEGHEEVRVIKGKLSEYAAINISKDSVFRDSLRKRNKIIIGPVTFSPELGESVIPLMLSKYSYFGDEFIGALAGAIPVSRIKDILEDKKIGKSGFVSLIDNNGITLVYPEKDKLLTKMDIAAKGGKTEVLVSDIKGLKSGFSRANIFGRDSVFAYAPLEETGWSLLVILPYHEFMEVPNNLKMASLGILILIFILSVAVSFWLTGGIIRPISKLVAVIDTISKGDLSRRAEVFSNGEIGHLARMFNAMVEKLTHTLVSRDELAKEVAQRKRAQEEIRSAYEQLKSTQAQLAQSSKMASLGLLAGGVAHEINNPLTGVLNNVQLVKFMVEQKKELKIEDFREILDAVEESAIRCKKITQSLLDFSHTSKGVLQPVSINEIIDKVTILIEHELNLQNITLKKELQPDLPMMAGDSQLLQQVIFDLLNNAKWAIRKKSAEERGCVYVKTSWDKVNQKVIVSVADTGIGIPKENLEKIFEPFFTTKPVGEGTGLGLSVVYNIVKAHRGNIEVESEVGKGATFKITLPLTT